MHLGDDPYIVGIVLTVSTHSGPHIVYSHERKTPLRYMSTDERKRYNDADDSESDIDWQSSEDEALPSQTALNLPNEKQSDKWSSGLKDTQEEDHNVTENKGSETCFGFEANFLSEMLCPPRSMCNKRFQLSIEDKVFFGIPIHVDDSGKWSQKPSSQQDQQDAHPEEAEPAEASTEECPMRMFHVCFVLDPPIAETNYVCDEIYEHVLSQFASLLRHEQRTKNYVWDQISTMLQCRDNSASLANLSSEIEQQSELAAALRCLYESISVLEIAHLLICGKLRPFQIPIDVEVHRVPMFVGEDSIYYGCIPTTAKRPSKEITANCPDCYGLLLLDDPDKILKKIEADPLGPLAALIHKISPLMSLEAMAKENNIPVKQLTNLAFSLVYWRCASIIIPLNHRYVYAVSPLAPLAKIYQLSEQFGMQFPMIAPLQRFLSSLSTGRNQHFSNYIPSRDHYGVYMDALAWVVRHNLVVHLQTFATIFIPRKVKLEVIREDEEQAGTSSQSSSDAEPTSPPTMIRKKSDHKWDVFENTEQLSDSFILEPARATLQEKKWIFKLASKRPPESQTLFYRLLKYFNGKDCLEQAIMHEKLSRTDLRRLLQEYGDNLVVHRHW